MRSLESTGLALAVGRVELDLPPTPALYLRSPTTGRKSIRLVAELRSLDRGRQFIDKGGGDHREMNTIPLWTSPSATLIPGC